MIDSYILQTVSIILAVTMNFLVDTVPVALTVLEEY